MDWDTELYRTIEAVVGEAIEDAIIVPSTCVGGTDNRFLRQQGIPAYGFIPCLLSPAEAAGFHGNDEHLTIDTAPRSALESGTPCARRRGTRLSSTAPPWPSTSALSPATRRS